MNSIIQEFDQEDFANKLENHKFHQLESISLKNPNSKETIDDLALFTTRMRLCHIGEKFDKQTSKPRGFYIQVVTSMPIK